MNDSEVGGRERREGEKKEGARVSSVSLHTTLKQSGEGILATSLDSFAEHVLWKMSSACVNTKPTGIEATCIVSGDKGRTHISSYFKQHKPRWWLANKASGFVSVYKYDKAKLKAH